MVDVDQSSVCAVGSLKFVALNIESKTILFFSSKLIPEKSSVIRFGGVPSFLKKVQIRCLETAALKKLANYKLNL